MPRRALINHRPWLLSAIIAAVAYYALRDSALGELWLVLIKGASVGFLAIYALRRANGDGAMLIATYLVFSALGDMGIVYSLDLGGGLFFCAHLAAMTLYLRKLRGKTTLSQRLLAAMLLLATPLVSYLLSESIAVALYGLALGGMAASAWMSRFPRYRVGAGAVLFVLSDWLIFAELGVLADSPLPDLLIWPLYFLGQFLIATGVVQTLRGEHQFQGAP